MDSSKVTMPEAAGDTNSSTTRVQRPANLAVAPRRVNMLDAVVGDVVHQVGGWLGMFARRLLILLPVDSSALACLLVDLCR
jgi:hypothetical protein